VKPRAAPDLAIAIFLAAAVSGLLASADIFVGGDRLSALIPASLAILLGLSGAAIAYRAWRLSRDARETESSAAAGRRPASAQRFDALTRLMDRGAFFDEIDRAIIERRRGGPHFALIMVDIDHFRNVNEIHGHAVGDSVLIEIASRMSAFQGTGTTIARLGADEFALLIEHASPSDEPRRVAQRLVESLTAPISIPQGLLRISATLGVATSEFQNTSREELMRAANLALTEAKREKRGTIRFFESGMDQALKLRTTLEADLRRALAGGEIVPFYQPLIALDDGRLTGFEVLARWQHPQYGIIPPASFIPLAEEIGRVGDMFYHLLARACADARSWPTELGLSVNVSPTQFAEPQLAHRILSILRSAGVDPSRLELEITENALVDEVSTARLSLTALRSAGVAVALDDFGTGYSSLRHLSDLPIDRLKIDRMFLEGASQNLDNWRIVRAIVQLAHALDLETTAEGIEIADVADILRDVGCDVGQGFLFGHPKSAAATADWLKELMHAPAGILPRLA